MTIKHLEYAGGSPRVSWGAIFAGSIATIALMLCLSTLGVGIGLVSAPSVSTSGGAAAGGIIGAAYVFAAGLVSFYAGGWIASRMDGLGRISDGVIHGLMSWCLATVLGAVFVTSAAFGALGIASSLYGGYASGSGRPAQTDVAPSGATGSVFGGGVPGTPAGTAETASRAAGAAGLFGFVMLVCDAGASAWGARMGTRVVRPANMAERREHLHATR